MNVTYQPAAEQWREGKALLEQATARLAAIMGPESTRASVTWDRIEDAQKRSLYQLKVRYFKWEATALFSRDQLENYAHMHVRLNRLWGDLLQFRNNEVHGQAITMSGQLSEAAENREGSP